MSFSMMINGKRVEAHDGELVLAAARRAGIHIPTLCEHKAVEPFGSCRLCMVEVTKEAWKGWKGLMTACLYPAAPDLIVETESERVLHVRRNVLDLLLARCPDSKLIQRLAAEHGVHRTTFTPRDSEPSRREGERALAAPDLCILCGLCTRVCETAATAAICTVKRGHAREVGTPWGTPPPDCIGCLACAHICPTGHIVFVETGFDRTIWERTFALVRCKDCGRPLPVTVEQAAFLAERQQMDPSYFERCEACQRQGTAQVFGRMARWNRIGLVQEPSAAPEVKP